MIRLDGNNLVAGHSENNTFKNAAAFTSIQHIDAIHTVDLRVRGNTTGGAGRVGPKSHRPEPAARPVALYRLMTDWYRLVGLTAGRLAGHRP